MRSFFFALCTVVVFTSLVLADVPNLISYQGRLTNSGGTPVANGNYSVVFTLYDAPAGGLVKWSETQSVATSDGLFSAQLGSVIAMNSGVFDDSTLWLGIKVGSDPELTPRTRLVSTPYARHATIGGGWRDDGSGVRLNDMSENVGIGTNVPTNRLHIVDATGGIFPLRIEGSNTLATVTELHNSTSGETWEHGVVGTAGVFSGTVPPGSSYFHKQGNDFPNVVLAPNKRVGIGRGTPEATLDVYSNTDTTIIGYFRGQTSSYGAKAVLTGEFTGAGNVSGIGVRGQATAAPGYGIGGVFQGGSIGAVGTVFETSNLELNGLRGNAYGDGTGRKYGVFGFANGSSGDRTGVYGYATGTGGVNYGVHGEVTGDSPGTFARAVGGTASGIGCVGGYLDATGSQCVGLRAQANGTSAWAVWARAFGTSSYAGNFEGNVSIAGTLSKSAGSFRIDHPLDPENKYLQHSFVESPDMMNIYNGNAVLGANGTATVTLPDWFDALNRDFRYQLTCVGGYAPVYISEKVQNNQFSIAGGTPGLEVSWMVTGIREDQYAESHRIQVEVDKRPDEKGRYIHPELFGQPQERGVDYERRSAASTRGNQSDD